MKAKEVIKFLILRSVGNFLLLFSIFGVLATFGPVLYYEVQFRIIQVRGVHYVVAPPASLFGKNGPVQPPSSEFSSILTGAKEQVLIPKDTQFNILIPKLGANAKVYSNVDPVNQDEFLPVLQQGVAHAKGTVFPGMKGNIYLFAHSADNFWDVGRYNAIFYLLKDLSVGDDIVVFFENIRHDYKVVDSRIIDPDEISYLIKSQQSDEEVLILQTCWPPGTTWKRLIVTAKPR